MDSYKLSLDGGMPRFAYDARKAAQIPGATIGVLQSKFYADHVDRCVEKYRAILHGCGVAKNGIIHEMLPGTLELPLACRTVIRRLRPDAVAVFGAVVETDTHHAQMVMDIFTKGIMDVMLQEDTPILVGVLAVPRLDLLAARCADDERNHGIKIALATTEIITFRRKYAGGD